MRNALTKTLAGLLLATLTAVPALAQDKAKTHTQEPAQNAVHGQAVEPARTATVTLTINQGAFLISASGGQGVLTFKGKKYPFRIGGLGFGGIGIQQAKAYGDVFHLTKPSDLAGTFGEIHAGYSVGEGSGRLLLKNTNGVVLRLKSTTKGVAFTLGGEGLVVEMGAMKKKK